MLGWRARGAAGAAGAPVQEGANGRRERGGEARGEEGAGPACPQVCGGVRVWKRFRESGGSWDSEVGESSPGPELAVLGESEAQCVLLAEERGHFRLQADGVGWRRLMCGLRGVQLLGTAKQRAVPYVREGRGHLGQLRVPRGIPFRHRVISRKHAPHSECPSALRQRYLLRLKIEICNLSQTLKRRPAACSPQIA